MKKMLMTSLAAGAVAVMAFGAIGTGAWFTDTASTNTVTLTSGAIDLQVNGDLKTPVEIKPIFPGEWSDSYSLEVYNQGAATAPTVKYRFTDEKISTDPGFYAKLNVNIRHTFAPPNCADPNWGTSVYNGPLADLALESYDTATLTGTAGFIGNGLLAPNITHVFCVEFQLDSTAGNDLQNSTAVTKIKVDATQATNPGWAQ